MKNDRITELDLFRGVCMIGVFISHLYFDLSLFYPIPQAAAPLRFLFEYGGILFVVLSGICITLGSKPLKRGCIVFACGMLITLVSFIVSRFLNDPTAVVRFGILHLLGLCMIFSCVIVKIPDHILLPLAVITIFMGFLCENIRIECAWLYPLGLIRSDFSSADYWPLFPHMGFFSLGIVAGRFYYSGKKPLFPALQGRFPILTFIGRHSLMLYLLQQPVCLALIYFLFILCSISA